MQYTLKKATGGNIRSIDKLSSSIGVKEAGVTNYLIPRPLKIVEIVIYNADIIKGKY